MNVNIAKWKYDIKLKMSLQQKQIRTIVEKYVRTYGAGSLDVDGDTNILFNITGAYRNEFHAQPMWDACVMTVALVLISCFVSPYVAVSAVCLYPLNNYVRNGYWFSNHFDGEFVEFAVGDDQHKRKFGVVIPTQEEEGRLESRNFVATQDRAKLTDKLDEQGIVYDGRELAVWSVGSSSSQCIHGHDVSPYHEFGIGVDAYSDKQIAAFLKAHSERLSHDGVLVVMNSAGYGVRVDTGIVYNDNKVEYDIITRNITPRTVGGTGDNKGAMGFIERLVSIHRDGDYNYVLAVVPRGDKTMPQGGSHSKQRVLDNLRWGKRVVVIEVSGKQTKRFELSTEDAHIDDDEQMCKNITETKITDASRNTHGSRGVFG